MKYIVYDNEGDLVAACKEASDAAILVTLNPQRGFVRLTAHGEILFDADSDAEEGDTAAAESFIRQREHEIHQRVQEQLFGNGREGSAGRSPVPP